MNPMDLPADMAGEGGALASSGSRQFVTFSVAGETFAVPMAPVQEIIRVPDVARMPLAPPALEGLSNLRGRVLPIVSLRTLFGVPARAADDATRALVINLGQPLGFVVDRVASVISVDAHEIEPATTIQSVVQADYMTGVIQRSDGDGGTELAIVLDFERLVRQQFADLSRKRSQRGDGADGARADDLHLAAQADEVGNDDCRLVSFTVGGQEYGLDIAAVQEIVQMPGRITDVPNSPPHVTGMISLRQRLLPLISLRSLFRLGHAAQDEQQRIVVVAMPDGARVGLITDAVKEVISVPRSQVEDMPAVLSRDAQLHELSAICRLEGGKRLVSVIAADRLLGSTAVREALALEQSSRVDGDADVRNDVTSHDSQRGSGIAGDDDTQVVIFRLGAEEFGVPIMSVQEIVRVPESLTRVPKTPPWVEGVINLRGTVLPVVDQRARFGMPVIERQEGQRIMVYTLNGVRTGFIVDSVAEVLRIPRDAIEPSPQLSAEQNRLISRLAKLDGDRRLVMLIEPAQLLQAHEHACVAEMAGAESGDLVAA